MFPDDISTWRKQAWVANEEKQNMHSKKGLSKARKATHGEGRIWRLELIKEGQQFSANKWSLSW